ncbi:MAG: DUF1499 domain-containing protein [Kiloniellaceae bacterium]
MRVRPAVPTLAYFVLGFAVLCALAAILSGLGHRWGWWTYQAGFSILQWAAYFGLGAAVVSLTGLALGLLVGAWRSLVWTVLGLVVASATVGVPWWYLRDAREFPAIHDITTDFDDPPRFVAVLPLRADAPNSADYGGPVVAVLQQHAYPDIAPAVLRLPPDRAFDLAAAAAREMGWEIVAEVPSERRLEATARTFWFGFKDDVVVRITPDLDGSRVDVRSVSRVGVSDLGANARRIRAYLARIAAAAGG